MDPVVHRLNKLANLAEQLVNEYNSNKLVNDNDIRYTISNIKEIRMKVALEDNSREVCDGTWFNHSMWWVDTAMFLIDENNDNCPSEDYTVDELLIWRRYKASLDEQCKKLESIIVKLS